MKELVSWPETKQVQYLRSTTLRPPSQRDVLRLSMHPADSPIPHQRMLPGDWHHRSDLLRSIQVGRGDLPERSDVAHKEQHAERERESERLGAAAAACLRQCRVGPTLRRNHIPRTRRLRQLRHLLPQVVFVFRLGLHRHPDPSTHCGDYIHHRLVCHGERTCTGNQVWPQTTHSRLLPRLLAALQQL